MPPTAKLKIAVIHGPNLNMLGQREPGIYGSASLGHIDQRLGMLAGELGCDLVSCQHNGEGELVDAIQRTSIDGIHGIIINPAAYTHTSVAIRDALVAVGLPTVEVHLSNVYARESFRHTSLIADVVLGRIMGFQKDSYLLGLRALVGHLRGAS
ncbi:MAG: type II 3-dehydroquinate dehydratase [Deltaproteobacteria bacterium]|nr:MAG: type II 3-dehydroquinate dehydratase [Deltaproteobacteria bacterium]